ncbi:uncharacterized protein N7479_004964 [Penicillium vulpinum]|uniref:Ig-like domain-containing protein n=1 Tax=Penicillium vulpinum TaxID=29845 RepID=A0A1V6RGQ7_9EURO|nr:uncharacterized protein N7479_004964 [Penicillium vulpinum]KAJ5965088.1 hypothetical protein N7479_004964 [Penicillium vulpinum]OQE00688.1 hypothetical protein PENVUL_c047G01631 [Penicillium vulpinum]
MRTSFFLAAALATLSAQADDASSTIVGFYAPPWDVTVPMYGGFTSTAASLVAIKSGVATYEVDCLKDAPKTDCNFPDPWTIIQGPETVSLNEKYIASYSEKETSYDITVTRSHECSLKASTEFASCTMSVGMKGSTEGEKYESSTSSKATYTTAPISDNYYELTVTAGLDLLKSTEATAAATSAETTASTGGAAGHAGALITAAPMVAAAVAALL